jgi:hypothetical protein
MRKTCTLFVALRLTLAVNTAKKTSNSIFMLSRAAWRRSPAAVLGVSFLGGKAVHIKTARESGLFYGGSKKLQPLNMAFLPTTAGCSEQRG